MYGFYKPSSITIDFMFINRVDGGKKWQLMVAKRCKKVLVDVHQWDNGLDICWSCKIYGLEVLVVPSHQRVASHENMGFVGPQLVLVFVRTGDPTGLRRGKTRIPEINRWISTSKQHLQSHQKNIHHWGWLKGNYGNHFWHFNINPINPPAACCRSPAYFSLCRSSSCIRWSLKICDFRCVQGATSCTKSDLKALQSWCLYNIYNHNDDLGLSENSVPLHPMVLLIIIPKKNGYFIGGMPHFQTYPFTKND